ncbi:hypothetical protein HDA32_000347 [Spinactinospora alkalitolerans]|uniref:Uncharacterized protein n=1 Tax=Spinactinospora alkalitolerans TaxID=687207 RepID=A0A852TPM7_9ACTN|nr:hypothetical protein [Spinactinospora alkalitolerans]
MTAGIGAVGTGGTGRDTEPNPVLVVVDPSL